MTRIRRARFAASLGVTVAAMLAVPGIAAAASLTITAPGSINHNTWYHVMVSGSVSKKAYVILVYQHQACKKTYPADQDALGKKVDGGSLIFRKVGPGNYDAQTVKLKGGGKHGGGTVDYCAYLYGANQGMDSKPLARSHRKVSFT